MDGDLSTVAVATELDGVLDGAVDVYTHSAPDLFPRRAGDVQVAQEAEQAGLAAIVHRNHFTSTAERATLVSSITGFRVLGALVLNAAAGGMSPAAVELALRMGSPWISMPTLDARGHRAALAGLPERVRTTATIGRREIDVLDGGGALLDAVHEILDLVAAHDAVLALGHLDAGECRAFAAAAQAHGVTKLVLTSPRTTMNLDVPALDSLMAFPAMHVEFTAHTMHPVHKASGRRQVPDDDAATDFAALVQRYGAGRCLLSSDTGLAGAPSGPELLLDGCTRLHGAGLAREQLVDMVRTTPRRLVGLTDRG